VTQLPPSSQRIPNPSKLDMTIDEVRIILYLENILGSEGTVSPLG